MKYRQRKDHKHDYWEEWQKWKKKSTTKQKKQKNPKRQERQIAIKVGTNGGWNFFRISIPYTLWSLWL